MQYVKRLGQLLLAAGGLSFSLAAVADGTNAGVTVTNNVSMSFTVATVPQTATTDVSFVVDRKLRLDVGTPNTNWVTAVAGQSGPTASYIQFEVTNNSNDPTDVVIALVDQTVQAVTGYDPVGTTQIAPTGIEIWEDLNANGLIDGTEVSLGTATGVYALGTGLAEDETRTLTVQIAVDPTATADLYQTYGLVAAVANAGVVVANDDSSNESPNVPNVLAVANDLAVEQIVFADTGSGNTEDLAYDFLVTPGVFGVDPVATPNGQASNAAGFRTVGVLGIAKAVEVLWDPISLNHYDTDGSNTLSGTEPKAIPGAVMMYVIGVNNQAPLLAESVTITDDVPGSVATGSGEPLLLGNSGSVPGINLPDTVDVDIDGNTVTFNIDNAGVSVDNLVYVRTCSAGATDPVSPGVAFAADPAEVSAAMGDCAAGDTGYIVYFATVDASAS